MGRIQRLDEAVVNKIAAGEVIQRPCNALKELLENSLDAGATQITVTVKDGGSRLLQVSDNGSGIQNDDLPILCERHTTSKLTDFSQLEQGIDTLGFRGEALSSISYVAHLIISTMTASDNDNPDIGHGWKVTYKDGIMDSGGPRPCAATVGTTITVEDLFYNVPLRKKALRSASEEYNAILDVCGRYAVHKTDVGMTVKRQGEARADMNTVATAHRQDTIRSVYGAEVAKHLLPVELEIQGREDDGTDGTTTNDDDLTCQVTGYVSGADYNGKKKTTMVLFINDRAVECTPLKRALEATYTAMLPKAIRPFIYLDIKLPGNHVDVNLHPTKKEVGFLHQEQLIEAVRGAVESALTGSNDSRTFVQTLLPGATQAPLPTDSLVNNNTNNEEVPRYYRPDRLVRTDAKTQTLHAFMPSQQQQQQQQTMVGTANEDAVRAAAVVAPKRVRTRDLNNNNNMGGGEFAFMPTAMDITSTQQMRRPVRHQSNDGIATTTNNNNNNPYLADDIPHPSSLHNNHEEEVVSAIKELISSFEKAAHPGLTDIFQNYTWVGMADSKRALLQYGTRLYLIDVYTLSKDMFYQQALKRLGAGRKIKILPGLSLQALAMTALEAEEVTGRWKESVEEGTKEEVTHLLCTLLVERKAELLAEYFAIEIELEEGEDDEDGDGDVEEGGGNTNITKTAALVHSLPQLIEHYTPDLSRLPAFILALGQKVIWSDEKRCISTIAEALSDLYAVSALVDKEEDQWTMQHVILPALKAFLKPGRHRASDGSIVELTRLETLYKVFERC
jgi:DNA mismatch repair protein MLH1